MNTKRILALSVAALLAWPLAGAPPAGARPPSPPQGPGAPAPVRLVLVSDLSRFGSVGTPEKRLEWGAIDTGIVSQNIAVFCAARGLGTRPRASVDQAKVGTLLRLKESQHPFLEHPVGYLPEAPASRK